MPGNLHTQAHNGTLNCAVSCEASTSNSRIEIDVQQYVKACCPFIVIFAKLALFNIKLNEGFIIFLRTHSAIKAECNGALNCTILILY